MIQSKLNVFLCPVVGELAWSLFEDHPTEVDGEPFHGYLDWMRLSNLATATSLPAISLPPGFMPDGKSRAIQLIGAIRGEDKLLTARALDEMLALKNIPFDPVTY